MRVLLVDTSATVRRIQRGILHRVGVEAVEEARDGFDALSKAGAFRPDVVLLGWRSGGMDPPQFVRALRGLGQEAPVVLIADQLERERVIEAVDAGVADVLIKPFTPESLVERIEAAVRRSGLGGRS